MCTKSYKTLLFFFFPFEEKDDHTTSGTTLYWKPLLNKNYKNQQQLIDNTEHRVQQDGSHNIDRCVREMFGNRIISRNGDIPQHLISDLTVCDSFSWDRL